jgi:hypothetical protein
VVPYTTKHKNNLMLKHIRFCIIQFPFVWVKQRVINGDSRNAFTTNYKITRMYIREEFSQKNRLCNTSFHKTIEKFIDKRSILYMIFYTFYESNVKLLISNDLSN